MGWDDDWKLSSDNLKIERKAQTYYQVVLAKDLLHQQRQSEVSEKTTK